VFISLELVVGLTGPTWNLLADLQDIFHYPFMRNAFVAGTVVAVMAAIVGYFVVVRRLAFACEALSHGGFAGATGAVLLGVNVFLGLVVFICTAGVVMGLLGERLRGRDIAIGATLTFSLALGSFFLSISTKMAGQATNILFGNILAISPTDVAYVAGFSVVALAALAFLYRPLLFASIDPDIADTRGVPVRAVGIAFMVLLGITIAASVQVVGVLLIFGLLILPAAAAQHVTAQPSRAIGLAVLIAVLCVWLGLLVGFYLPYPPSFFITSFAFASYVGIRSLAPGVGSTRRRSVRAVQSQSVA
jgi:zinc/manganese transport system permease protein